MKILEKLSNPIYKFYKCPKQLNGRHQKNMKMMPTVGPPKLCLIGCFDLKNSNSALPNSILCTLS
jgi:hypothetical protein